MPIDRYVESDTIDNLAKKKKVNKKKGTQETKVHSATVVSVITAIRKALFIEKNYPFSAAPFRLTSISSRAVTRTQALLLLDNRRIMSQKTSYQTAKQVPDARQLNRGANCYAPFISRNSLYSMEQYLSSSTVLSRRTVQAVRTIRRAPTGFLLMLLLPVKSME